MDIFRRRIYPARVEISNGIIQSITEITEQMNHYLLPGFVDSHIHIESSLLVPSEFARLAVVHGTVAAVSDPHEIANVLGITGIEFMVDNAATVPFKFYFGAPACVPATPFETAGARLSNGDLESLFKRDDIHFLSEMMNAPGVINRDPAELDKITLARQYGKCVDGHSPGFTGRKAQQYAQAGITTDHECTSLEEARDKIRAGMLIQIREGSAAKNLEDLLPLIDEYPDQVMLCSDDRHPDDLVEGHINEMVKRAISAGADLFNVIRAATVNPANHYGLGIGLLRVGDPADLIEVNSLQNMGVLKTIIDGNLVAENSVSFLHTQPVKKVNYFKVTPKVESDFAVPVETGRIRVIEVTDGQIVTGSSLEYPRVEKEVVVSDLERDILKLSVVNRYKDQPPAVAFVRGFGIRSGALASSVAHDSHNIVTVGTTDIELTTAINLIIANRGGIAFVNGKTSFILPLPIAGIMTDAEGYGVGRQYAELNRQARQLGSALKAPFMTLSFMALLVIPELKLSDKGLFDGNLFTSTSLFTQ
ncbi:MAG: adenine deaminase [Fidelibacterota bacterium]